MLSKQYIKVNSHCELKKYLSVYLSEHIDDGPRNEVMEQKHVTLNVLHYLLLSNEEILEFFIIRLFLHNTSYKSAWCT